MKSMGLRSEKNVALQILQENTWESNLVPDIAGVDLSGRAPGADKPTTLGGAATVLLTTTLSMVRLRERRDCAGSRHKDRCAPPARRVQAKRVCKKISLAAQEVWIQKTCTVYHRRHSFQKLPLQPHTRDDTTNRGRRRVPDQVAKWEELYLGRGRSRILPCQGRCLGAGAGGAAGRAACHAAPAGGDGFRAVPDQLHAGLCRNSGPGGFGASIW